MRIRNISLTAQQDDFVEQLVKTGEYENASEAIRDAMRMLQQKLRRDTVELRALGVQLTTADLDALVRSDFTRRAGVDVKKYMKGLTSAQRQRVFTRLRAFVSSGWRSRISPTSSLPLPNGGVLRGSVATQRSLRRPCVSGSADRVCDRSASRP